MGPMPIPRRKPKRHAYDTELTDGQWALIAPLIPEAEPGNRPRKAPTRELVNPVLFFVRSGRLRPQSIVAHARIFCRYRAGFVPNRAWDREGTHYMDAIGLTLGRSRDMA